MEIGTELKYGDYSAQTLERFEIWDRMWEEITPFMHLERSETWDEEKRKEIKIESKNPIANRQGRRLW